MNLTHLHEFYMFTFVPFILTRNKTVNISKENIFL